MLSRLPHRFALLGMVLSLCAALPAQDVDRTKYPDFSWQTSPNPKLGVSALRAPKLSSTEATRPSHVNNADLKFFPPVFSQDGGSCGSASRICYMFTYELNCFRDLNGSLNSNNYPSHFVWLLTNSPSGKDEFVQNIGVPSSELYGGRTYSALFGNQDCENEDFGWMTGYDKWYAAMSNRMLRPSNFPESVESEAGREAVKNWLWNHNGDTDFKAGGICGIGVASGGEWVSIPKTAANDAAGVTGQKYVKRWGTSVDHALTIVGYDDRIEFDLNGNGIYGEADADELGAWIIVNSWGNWWCNGGFVYCPYAYGGAWFVNEGTDTNPIYSFGSSWWTPEVYQVRKNYVPQRTIKLKMDYSRRSEICLSAGISTDLNADAPERTIVFDHFRYAGDGNWGNTNPAPEVPMLGRWADGKLHDEPMEFGYDLTDLTAGFDKNMPLKYFFIVETRSWGAGSGHIYEASIIDYAQDAEGLETPFNLAEGGTVITSAGNKTVISTVVYGEGYYAPRNLSYNEGTLTWSAPVVSGHTLTGYKVYREGTALCEVSADECTCSVNEESQQTTYAVTALYEGNVESASVTACSPITSAFRNTSVNLKKSGFTIPDVFASKYDQATLEYWIKPNSLANWNQAAGPGWGTFMLHANANGSYTAGWNTDNRVESAAGSLTVGTWTHVAIVVDHNVFTTYINGTKAGSVTSETFSGLGGFGSLTFTANEGSATDASIDELRIWNYARSAGQIASGKGYEYIGSVLPKGLLAYYRGDTLVTDGVTLLRDFSGNGHHATVLNSNIAVVSALKPTLSAPTAALAATIDPLVGTAYAGLPVNLTATCSESVNKMEWTAEDAGAHNVATASPTLIFQHTGEQTVKLTVYNKAGSSYSTSATINVEAAPATDAAFTLTRSEVPAGDRVTFMAATPQVGYLYAWSMPGARVEQASTPYVSATYDQAGTYTVTLTVCPPGGTARTSSQTIQVVEVAPQAEFNVTPGVILKGNRIFLKDQSKYGPTSWSWMLHNNQQDYLVNGKDISVSIDAPGVYDVTLSVANATGTGTKTRERGLIVCNADSRNGLNFRSSGAAVTAETPLAKGKTAFTIDWWMNADQCTNYCNGIGDSESTLLLKTAKDGSLMLCLAGKTSSSKEGFIVPGEWHHYAVTFRMGNVSYYRDGELINTTSQGAYSISAALTAFVLGGDNTPMNGCIDELRVWTKQLTQEQLRTYANAPIEDVAAAESDLQLQLYYDFNQNGGDVIDRTSNGRTGVRSGFGPDGDAWGLSSGVFCLNFDEAAEAVDVTADYLTNYKKPFSYDTATPVNPANSTRFYAIKDWQLDGTVTLNGVTTGAHVDRQKSTCFTVTTLWDNFSTLSDHKAYQTLTLPAGAYVFTVTYDSSYEGECETSYIAVAEGAEGLPNTSELANRSIAYAPMRSKSEVAANTLSFTLTHETTVSLGLVMNMSGESCMTIQSFSLTRKPVTVLEADTFEGYDLDIDASGFASLCLPYATEIPADVEVYTAQSVSGNVVTMAPVTDGILPANTGVIVKGAFGSHHFAAASENGTARSILEGCIERGQPDAGKRYFQIGVSGEDVGFYPFTDSALTPYSAYLVRNAGEEELFYVTNVFPTELDEVRADGTAQDRPTYYDLTGRRVDNPTRGIYIVNRKKIIIR